MLIEEGDAGDRAPLTDDPVCERCGAPFKPSKKTQRYCVPACQKKASRHSARGSRGIENKRRNREHYERAAWLSYDVLRSSSDAQRQMLLAILEAASSTDAPLRNILFDPTLLGADRHSPIGKLYPDTRCPDTPNIAKMVYAFCREEWGVSTREAILDHGKPARRRFTEEVTPNDPPEHPQQVALRDTRPDAASTAPPGAYDWRKLARAMGDPGWRRYFGQEELDGFL